MATINYTLQKTSSELFIKYDSKERIYINEKIKNFEKALKSFFGNDIEDVFVFGSFTRDTILPRYFDEKSDIDVLIVFNQAKNKFSTETYRAQLKRFATKKYPRTVVLKDHPSVVLEMTKIKFDLVPCRYYEGFLNSYYQIPDKNGAWMKTDPNGFNKTLSSANTKYNSIVKPIIRLLKRWNAHNNYPYNSFELEKIVADMNFSRDNYQTGFLYAIDKLPTNGLPDYQVKKVKTLRNNKVWILEYLERDNQEKAIEVVGRILGLNL